MVNDHPSEQPVRLPIGTIVLDGDLTVPPAALGLVLFAHGSGSSRHSPRNRQVATALQGRGYATLLMDLLTPEEDEVDLRTRELRFDITRLAERVVGAIDWLAADERTRGLPLAVFGASTGAAAALVAAAARPDRVALVISRGGRVDLAGPAIRQVRAPTLMIVGEADPQVRRFNDDTAAQMTAAVDVRVVPGATHLFEEPGALDVVVDLALDALRHWLGRSGAA